MGCSSALPPCDARLALRLDQINSKAKASASTKAKAKLAGTLKAAGIAGYILDGGKVGDRINDHHLTLAEKRASREAAE